RAVAGGKQEEPGRGGEADAAATRASAARAAAKPLRPAPSMVAGRPVAVQSPARYRPRTGVIGPGRSASAAGSEANVASASRRTSARRTGGPPQAGEKR